MNTVKQQYINSNPKNELHLPHKCWWWPVCKRLGERPQMWPASSLHRRDQNIQYWLHSDTPKEKGLTISNIFLKIIKNLFSWESTTTLPRLGWTAQWWLTWSWQSRTGRQAGLLVCGPPLRSPCCFFGPCLPRRSTPRQQQTSPAWAQTPHSLLLRRSRLPESSPTFWWKSD